MNLFVDSPRECGTNPDVEISARAKIAHRRLKSFSIQKDKLRKPRSSMSTAFALTWSIGGCVFNCAGHTRKELHYAKHCLG